MDERENAVPFSSTTGHLKWQWLWLSAAALGFKGWKVKVKHYVGFSHNGYQVNVDRCPAGGGKCWRPIFCTKREIRHRASASSAGQQTLSVGDGIPAFWLCSRFHIKRSGAAGPGSRARLGCGPAGQLPETPAYERALRGHLNNRKCGARKVRSSTRGRISPKIIGNLCTRTREFSPALS